MVFFIIILSFIVLHEMGFLTLSMSHVIKEKTLVLLKLCEILCGYMCTFLMCWQGEFVLRLIIVFFILMTIMFDSGMILKGEIRCPSVLGIKGSKDNDITYIPN